MQLEFDTFGFYLSNHIVTEYRTKYNKKIRINELSAYFDKNVDIVLYVDRLKEIVTKANNKMLFITASDETNKIDVTVFPRLFEYFKDVEKGNVIIINAHVEKRFDKLQLVVNNIIDIIK